MIMLFVNGSCLTITISINKKEFVHDTKPVIDVSFDNNDVLNDKYFKLPFKAPELAFDFRAEN